MSRCTSMYERDGGREHGDRIVQCDLVQGHSGEHEELDTDHRWDSDDGECDALPWLADAPARGEES